MLKQMALLIGLVFFVNTVHANELKSFPEVERAIADGKQLNFVVDFAHCTGNNGSRSNLPVIGAFQPKEILNIQGHKITASDLHFTVNHPAHINQGIYESITYHLFPSNQLTVKTITLNAKTMDILEDGSMPWGCMLGEAAKVFAH